jgi:hypothetical protein
MSIDSSANLLFNISADPSAAQSNITAFRGLLSKDLGAMGAEFEGWSKKVFGNLTTVSGGFAAVGAALAAGVVAAAGAMSAAADKAADYALKIEDGGEKTGIASEDMSKLHYAARMTETRYEALVGGLTKFASTIDKARDATSQQAAVFHRMGISQAEIEAGSRNMLPLFYRVTDAFKDQMTAVERTAVARDLFSRGGAELVEMLKRGSGALRDMGDEATRLGLIITEQDIVAAKELKAEMAFLKAETEALTLSLGKLSMPLKTDFLIGVEGMIGGMKAALAGGSGDLMGLIRNFTTGFAVASVEAAERIQRNVRAGMQGVGEGLEPPEGTKKVTQDFWGLTNVLEQLRAKSAAAQGEEAKLGQEFAHLRLELGKAGEEFKKLRDSGKLDPEAIKREQAALLGMFPALIKAESGAWQELIDKRAAAVEAAGVDLQQRLLGQQERTAEGERAAWDAEIVRLTAHLAKAKTLTEANQALIAEVHRAGLYKIAREQNEAFVRELATLQHELAATFGARQTNAERLKWQYDQDLVKFGEVEEAKTLKTASSEAEREIIRRQYDMNRAAAFARYGEEMTALYNSQGWQGLFGAEFAQRIRGNEALLREWAYSADQSLMMVRVAAESLREMAVKTFGQFAQAMGQNIAQAIVYKKSIGEAMRAAAAETMAAIAAESFVQAIYATAIGFIRLAQHDYVAAGQAFQAAGIFAGVGVAAAVAGRAIAPKQAGAGAAGGAGEGVSGGGSAAGASEAQETRGPRVQIIINGHIVGRQGIEEMMQMMNEAVRDRDVSLVASGVKNNTRLLR